MDQTTPNGGAPVGAPVAIRWYSRAALDEYLTGAEAERVRLRSVIDEANERLARASAALGLHQTMMEMLLESQRDVREIRRSAEMESARIIAEAEREIRRIPIPADPPEAAVVGDPVPVHFAPDGAVTRGVPAPPAMRFDGGPDTPDTADDQFFTYLKSALDEDEPLGPPHHD